MIKTNEPQLGDTAFEVEWCTDLPVNEYGDCEPDLATYKVRYCTTLEVARATARRVLSEAVCGDVRITPVTLTDPFGDNVRRTFLWEPSGDSEYVDADSP
jgi:hypothetical protein